MLIIFGIAIGVGLVILGVIMERRSDSDGIGVCIVGGTIAVTLVIIVIATYTANIGRVAYMEAFYNTNASNYATTIDKTDTMFSDGDFLGRLVDGSLEKTNLATAVANRLAEQRDAINEYNRSLANYRAYRNNWMFFILYPPIPDNLEAIKLGEK